MSKENIYIQLIDKTKVYLKKRGMKYVETVIIYSYLQSTDIVNDHETTRFKY